MDKKKGLGRGLESLFALYDNEIEERPAQKVNKNQTVEKKDNITEIEVSKIKPNPNQPRKHFDEEALQETCKFNQTSWSYSTTRCQ